MGWNGFDSATTASKHITIEVLQPGSTREKVVWNIMAGGQSSVLLQEVSNTHKDKQLHILV